MCGVSWLGRRSIVVFADIQNVEIVRDLVPTGQVVSSTIQSFDKITLVGEWSGRFSDKRRKGSCSRACGVGRGHRDALTSFIGYRIVRSCIKPGAPHS